MLIKLHVDGPAASYEHSLSKFVNSRVSRQYGLLSLPGEASTDKVYHSPLIANVHRTGDEVISQLRCHRTPGKCTKAFTVLGTFMA